MDSENEWTKEDERAIEDIAAVQRMNQMTNQSSTVFIKAEDKYKDHLFSAYTFFLFGFLGVLFSLLNITGVISFLALGFSQYVMLAVFLGFFLIGVFTYRKAVFLKSSISNENRLTDEIKDWLQKEITPAYLSSLTVEDSSEEENFFTQTEEVKERMMIQFDDIEDALADTLIEEHLNQLLP